MCVLCSHPLLGLGSQTTWVTVVPQCPHLPNSSAYYNLRDESLNTSEYRVSKPEKQGVETKGPPTAGLWNYRAGEVKYLKAVLRIS